jgi:hypothetical protein
MDNSNLCIVTAAQGEYKQYAPFFMFCAKKTGCKDFKVHLINDNEMPYSAACKRFLLRPGIDAEYYYITDVDMMLIPEGESIVDFHVKEMNKTGLCYSNTPRKNERRGAERLTGLHFCKREWYEKVNAQREKFIRDIEYRIYAGGYIDDELMLMDICRASKVGIPPASKIPIARRHHGIHMGTLRAYKHCSLNTLKSALIKRVTPDQARYWQQEIVTDPTYKALLREVKSEAIRWEFDFLDQWTKGRAKQ